MDRLILLALDDDLDRQRILERPADAQRRRIPGALGEQRDRRAVEQVGEFGHSGTMDEKLSLTDRCPRCGAVSGPAVFLRDLLEPAPKNTPSKKYRCPACSLDWGQDQVSGEMSIIVDGQTPDL